jgi:hypothetical protein
MPRSKTLQQDLQSGRAAPSWDDAALRHVCPTPAPSTQTEERATRSLDVRSYPKRSRNHANRSSTSASRPGAMPSSDALARPACMNRRPPRARAESPAKTVRRTAAHLLRGFERAHPLEGGRVNGSRDAICIRLHAQEVEHPRQFAIGRLAHVLISHDQSLEPRLREPRPRVLEHRAEAELNEERISSQLDERPRVPLVPRPAPRRGSAQ